MGLGSYLTIEDFDSGGDEHPTPFTDALPRATFPHFIVIRHIDIKHQFAKDWGESRCATSSCPVATHTNHKQVSAIQHTKSTQGIAHPRAIYRPHFETRQIKSANFTLRVIRVVKRVVSETDVSLECGHKFAVGDGWVSSFVDACSMVVQPCEGGLE